MTISIIETFIEGKTNDINLCEDGFIITNDYAVVIDGATAKSNMDFNGKTSARFIMEKIKEFVVDINGKLNAKEFIDEISLKLLENYKNNGWLELFENEPRHRPTASMVVYSNHFREVWFFGDCRALIGETQEGNEKYIDEVTQAARKLFIEGKLRSGVTVEEILENDIGREYIMPMLELQNRFQNSNIPSIFSYSVVDGWEFKENDIKIIKVSDSVQYVVLTTDGYKNLKSSLDETEKLLMEQLKNDPLAINELFGTKSLGPDMNSVDDRAYVKIKI